jgi:hypothetical protein
MQVLKVMIFANWLFLRKAELHDPLVQGYDFICQLSPKWNKLTSNL